MKMRLRTILLGLVTLSSGCGNTNQESSSLQEEPGCFEGTNQAGTKWGCWTCRDASQNRIHLSLAEKDIPTWSIFLRSKDLKESLYDPSNRIHGKETFQDIEGNSVEDVKLTPKRNNIYPHQITFRYSNHKYLDNIFVPSMLPELAWLYLEKKSDKASSRYSCIRNTNKVTSERLKGEK